MNLILLWHTLVQFVVSLTSLKSRAQKRAAAHTKFARPVVFNLALVMMIAASLTTNGASVGSSKECLGIRAEQSHLRTGILKNSCATSGADGQFLAAEAGVVPTQEGLIEISQHLSTVGAEGPEFAMYSRLTTAFENGETLTGTDAAFYQHELIESSLVDQAWISQLLTLKH